VTGRKRPIAARCRSCKAPVVFFRSPFTGNVRAFNPKPIDMRTPLVEAAYPVLNRRAYKLHDVIEELVVVRRCSTAEAEEEARDLPWHTLHACSADIRNDAQGGTR
jgi:hypothetical protein